jgi:co-chaperonin GroES (HSP10)
MNTSGLQPVGRAVLVRPYEPEKKSGLIEVPDFVQDRLRTVDQRVVIVEVGPTAWSDEPQPRAHPGDKVLVSAFSGYMAKGTKDGNQYRFVNDKDIFAKIVEELG